MGRDSKYKPEYDDLLIEHMRTGKSVRSFASIVEVDEQTLYNWSKQHASFLGAINTGRGHAYRWWEEQGQTGLWDQSVVETGADGSVTKSFSRINPRIFELFMQNMFNWSRKVDQTSQATVAITGGKELSDELLQAVKARAEFGSSED